MDETEYKKIKFKLKRFMTPEELEEFNRLRDIEFPDTKLSSSYIASLDLYEPTNLEM